MTLRRARRTAATAASTAALLLAAACGAGGDDPGSDPGGGSPNLSAGDWDAVLAEARGQTVDWYMYGGDQRLNGLVEGLVTDRLAELGVTLRQVRISDTADAVAQVLGERQAGRDANGSVDAIWLNGENFATGVQADLWRCGWADDLPNAEHVDLEDPAVATDFGVPTRGCEAAWQQASSALVYDSAQLSPADVTSVDSLLSWVGRNPGRFTYPAPPDFTGSMAVRTLLYDTVGAGKVLERLGAAGAVDGEAPTDVDEAAYDELTAPLWERLQQAEPSLWRGGETYPQDQEQVEKLYADGEISAFLTYGPGAVGSLVEDGVFPATTREAVLSVGNLANVSFVAIPANAGDPAGALVLADVLQDPEVQLAMYARAGIYPVIDLDRVDEETRAAFEDVAASPSVLTPQELAADALPELPAPYISRIEEDWESQVLRR